ncbi:hypothetical protein PYW08_000082 [Mythimna loreyi]|uniref:Uncharacterized protein n=1 Tax=Mythimna loreyi TaxID=667449 RepID=A0ACC2RA78_9NEOP|nr:hypothetical protein PYW08_000082 [Mythimna loreyi]
MDDEVKATLDGQFSEFAKYMGTDRDGTSIDLYRSDYWLRQSKVLDDRVLTMTDTGLIWLQFGKTELAYNNWCKYLTELCIVKNLCQAEVEVNLTCCGLPGVVPVLVPQYRSFFDTYKFKNRLINEL